MFGCEIAGNNLRFGKDRAAAECVEEKNMISRADVHAPKIEGLRVVQVRCVTTRMKSRLSGGKSECGLR